MDVGLVVEILHAALQHEERAHHVAAGVGERILLVPVGDLHEGRQVHIVVAGLVDVTGADERADDEPDRRADEGKMLLATANSALKPPHR